jgi:hypothetical protein
METGRCREDGSGVVDWPPGRPQPRGLLEIFSLSFFFRLTFFLEWKQGAFGGSVLKLGEAVDLTVAGALCMVQGH